MSHRRTIVVVAVSAVVGAIGAAVLFGALAARASAGMVSLALVVVGLTVGGGIAAFVVFAACLRWAVTPRPTHPWQALGVMALAAALDVLVMLLGLALTVRTDTTSWGIPFVVLASAAFLAGGASLALRVGQRRYVSERVAPEGSV